MRKISIQTGPNRCAGRFGIGRASARAECVKFCTAEKRRKAAAPSGAAVFVRTGACFVQNPPKRACGPL
ncbi:MAG: hypothetical protein DBY17_04160 [Oscillospiraceae bacterium]|nr:MAG: hypothetical protein DBY17_04160 [Oscillospiraceae bacterium]